MQVEEARKRIIVALDVSTVDEAIEIVEELGDHVGAFKVGFEFIFAMLAMLIAVVTLNEARANLSKIRRLFVLLKNRVLFDCKLADIPNTMGKAVQNIVKMMFWGFNFHASAGTKSIEAAVKHAGNCLTFGVTVLTSIKDECFSIFGGTPNEKVAQFAEMLVNCGATGVICSAAEGPYLRGTARDDQGNLFPESEERKLKFARLKIATPGIRPLWAPSDDQQRIVTPHQAINVNGVDYIIIGRPITRLSPGIKSRVHAAQLIAQEIAEGREITQQELLAA